MNARTATSPPLRVVQLTPPARGAIAVLRVDGPQAMAVVETRFRPAGRQSVHDASEGRVLLGWFGPEPAEQVVLRRCEDQAVELCCHGGPLVVERIVRQIVEAGAASVGWRRWASEMDADPIAAAARVALADARTETAAAVLLDQYHGALRRAVQDIQKAIRAGQAASAAEQIAALLAWTGLGRHLTSPWRVVLAGRPNVGKSSLLNALVGYTRAIAHPAPGTTRDVLAAETAVAGWSVELIDTAGLRAAEQPLERAGVALAEQQVAAADLVLLVCDRSVAWESADEGLLARCPQALVVHNKCDLVPAAAGGRPAGLAVSALTGEGIGCLVETIGRRLVPYPPPRGTPVPFTGPQCAVLHSAAKALSEQDLERAQVELEGLERIDG